MAVNTVILEIYWKKSLELMATCIGPSLPLVDLCG